MLLAWLVSVATLSQRSAADGLAPRYRVAYVGTWQAVDDKAFAAFNDALTEAAGPLGLKVDATYVMAVDGSQAALLQAVQRAARLRPAVIVAPTGDTARAARRGAAGVPVVFASFLDPVDTGIVDALSAPGWPGTGVSLADALDAKRLELLRDAYPAIRRVGVLADHSFYDDDHGSLRVRTAARTLGLDVALLVAPSQAEVDALFTADRIRTADAWYVPPTYVAYVAEALIIGRLHAAGRPAIFGTAAEVEHGGALGYSQDMSFVWPTVAALVVRVLGGEDPSGIPVERPRRFLLAARGAPWAGGTAISPGLLRRADLLVMTPAPNALQPLASSR